MLQYYSCWFASVGTDISSLVGVLCSKRLLGGAMLVDLLALDVFAVTAKHNMEQKKGTLKSILMYSIINKNNHTLLKKQHEYI